jgi:putative transposase
VVTVPQRKAVVSYLRGHYPISERRACEIAQIHRSVRRYRSTRPSQEALRRRIREIAATRIRYGYRRIHVLLRREGWQINRKRVHRLYCLEGLQLRAKRPRRHVSAAHRQPPKRVAGGANEAWSMDFVADQALGGAKFRMLTVVDVFTRECLAIEAGQRLRGDDVVRVLNRLIAERGAPKRLFCDNGSEFTGRLLDLWAYHNQVTIEFSRPGKPTDNAHIESFNGSFRDECLNVHWFSTLGDARVKIEAWRQEYNESRPHKALNQLSPLEYVATLAT